MVGFPASGPKRACSPGRVSTLPLLKTTSWQSGETPCGRSDGDMSVTRTPKISMGASNEPAVLICCLVIYFCDIYIESQAPFRRVLPVGVLDGACQALRGFAAPGVRVS